MKVVIAGGSGFIGTKLAESMMKKGHEVVILTRSKGGHRDGAYEYIEWLNEGTEPESKLQHAHIFINLAGVSLNDGRWTEKQKKLIYESRMNATKELNRIISKLETKPLTFINASAIGIYPASTSNIYIEESKEVATDFLGKTVKDWEECAGQVSEFGIRTLFMRFGVVLGEQGTALSLMTLPYQFFIGGTIGSGKQWLSWVHIEDVIRSIEFVIENVQIEGPVNVTAPEPIQMKQFGQKIGTILSKPHWLKVPSFALKLLLGEKSKLVLEGQHVIPEKLLQAGFKFQYPTIDGALKHLLLKSSKKSL